jgi:membrane protein DedA with SNARE-associated domain
VLTAIGSAVWCFGIAGAGVALGSSWEHFHENFRYADYVVVFLVVLGAGYAAYKLLRRRARRRAIESPTEG